MDYMTAKEAAELWGITQRRVTVLCSENRIENAEMKGGIWLIPSEAEKPIDGRRNRMAKKRTLKPIIKWAGGKGQLIEEISSQVDIKSVKKEEEEQKMKVLITIEESISQNFLVEADSLEDAMEIAESLYRSGDFVLDNANLVCKQMSASCEETGEATEWVEF